MSETKTYWIANSDLEDYADSEEPTKYPQKFTALVKKRTDSVAIPKQHLGVIAYALGVVARRHDIDGDVQEQAKLVKSLLEKLT